MQVLITAAGRAGDQLDAMPPPLEPVLGRPRIEHVIRSCAPAGADCRIVIVLSAEDERRFGVSAAVARFAPGCVIALAGPTRGALCSALLAEELLDPDQPLLVCVGDIYFPGGVEQAIDHFAASAADIGIITFTDTNPRWSFARVDDLGMVTETAEKQPISDLATAGVYWYRRAGEFIESGYAAIRNERTVKGLYYLAPAINESIARGRRVRHWHMDRDAYFPLGTAEDIE
ncbi:MAG: glycosyltransferase family 2 protein, partial [Thermomicrobiales bacterium]